MKPASLALLLLLALPFFVALDDSSIWDANEAFYVETPRQMLERGDWIVPYFNGQPRLNKPPLSYWVVAAAYRIFSVSVFWERLLMALLAYGSVLVVFWIGALLFQEKAALWGAGIFATTFRFLFLARRLFIDVLMLFCILVAVAFFLSWMEGEKRSRFALATVFFALAFLSKGPVALLPIPALLLYLVVSRRAGLLGRAPWLTAGAAFVLITVPWFALIGSRLGWEVVKAFFLKENLGRYAFFDFGPPRGPFYYAGAFMGDFFPWSILFLGALGWWILGSWSSAAMRSTKSRVEGDPMLLILFWVATYFLFFSLSQNKQEYYILPIYPAVALWLGIFLQNTRPPRWFLLLVSSFMVVAAVAILFAARQLFPGHTWFWIPPLFLIVAATLLFRTQFQAAIAGLSAFYFLFFGMYLHALEQYKPVHHFARTIQHRVRAGDHPKDFKVGYYSFAAPSLAFYLQRPILELVEKAEVVRHLESSKLVYLVMDERAYLDIKGKVVKPLQIVEVRPKLYTTARTLREGFELGRSNSLQSAWARPIYLISNQPSRRVGSRTGL